MADTLYHDLPGGGGANSGRGCFHLSFRSGSRAGGASARGAYAYITRTDEYGDSDRDAAIYTESDHMPSWAQDAPQDYWDAADENERANGRLYVSADFALPRDLDEDERIALARAFAHALTDAEHLPYTLAIHAGRDAGGEEHNPHAHLMFSERQNDGIERSPERWFGRADSEHPEHGGAPKSRTFHGPAWVEEAREKWAAMTNATLERCGRTERVDHRSYARQGVDREPGRHYGPSAAYMVQRGEDHERLNDAAAARDREESLRTIDQEIAQLEAARATLLRDGLPEEERQPAPEPQRPDRSQTSGADRGDDSSRGR
jgi:hypothetical protein